MEDTTIEDKMNMHYVFDSQRKCCIVSTNKTKTKNKSSINILPILQYSSIKGIGKRIDVRIGWILWYVQITLVMMR